MHRSIFFLVSMACILLTACKEPQHDVAESQKLLINGDWYFLIDSSGASSPDELREQMQWTRISIPHTPRIEPLVVNDQWQGTCWYRKELEYKPEYKDKQLYLRFEGAMNVAEVWANNTKKIKHYGGYLPFVINITEDLIPGKKTILYVRLNNEDNEVTGPKPLKTLDFNMYGGIYRDVWLLVKTAVHITDEQYANRVAGGGIFVSYPEVKHEKAVVRVQTNLENSGEKPAKVTLEQVLKRGGKKIASTQKQTELTAHSIVDIIQTLDVKNPSLWSPEYPNLYTLETLVKVDGKITDKQSTRIGIRKFEFIENKLYINGEEAFLRGVNRHQEYPYIGYALSNDANYRDAYKIKQAGFDYVRLSHYPHSTSFMDACDELGIVVIDAILGWQYYKESDPFRDHVLQTCRDLIRRDRNHPSVLAWEVSLNESWMPEEFIDSLTSFAKQEYPFEECYTAGWQQYGFDIYLQARQHRLGEENEIPDKPYIVSEYGDWEYYAMNAGLNQDAWSDLMPQERSSRKLLGSSEKDLLQQALNLQEAHNSNYDTPAVADGYWVMYDYNRGYSDDLEASGIMSIFRLPKFAWYFYQSQRDPDEWLMGKENAPMIFIASYYNERSSENIRIFSNCEEVELFRDNASLGKRKPDKNSISTRLNHPPFTFSSIAFKKGSLSAVGYIDGKAVARHSISTAGKPAGIRIEADLSGREWKSGCKDALFIHARVIDENGQTVPDYQTPISFAVSGEAYIIGNDQPTPEAGIGSVLVMAGDKPGKITVSASSGELQPEVFTMETNACGGTN
ncbi:MAG: DUF4982 domain-containing protein [Bacteroidales bacterium]|nr:DUF4982 domain-containing protein [Bacteroidales bacterium]